MTTYKNQAGIIYSVRDADGGPEVMLYDTCEKYNTGWQISDRLKALCAEADADTAEKMQNVLDGYAKKLGWETCENPTDAAAGASEATEIVTDASGDEPEWLSDSALHLAKLLESRYGVAPIDSTIEDFKVHFGKSFEGASGPDCLGYSCTPKGVSLMFGSFGRNKSQEFTWEEYVKYLHKHIADAGKKEESVCTTKSFQTGDAAAIAESPVAIQTVAETQTPSEDASSLSAPASRADAGVATQNPSNVGSACSAAGAFDYSGLTEQDVADLHLAEREYSAGKKMAEIGLRRMADGVAIAHDTLCGTVVAQCDNGKFAKKEDTFRAWCASVGIGKDTAYRLLQVSALFDHSSPNEQKLLDGLPATLLYAAAKPNAPAEAVEAVKTGDVTTMPEYKALLAELNRVKHEAELDRKECENTNAQADRLLAERNAMNQEVIRLRGADKRAEDAERRAREAEAAHAAKIRELESRPVDVAVRKPTDAEIERYRQEGYAKAQKEFAARRDDESDFCETIADHAEAVADSCAEALAGWFRLAADIDDAAYAAGAEHIKALWLALREALQSGAWPTDDLDDDDDEEYDPDDDDEENSDE